MTRLKSTTLITGLLFSLLLGSSTASGGAQYVDLHEFNERINDIIFRSATEGYALGDEYIWHTTDAGESWTFEQSLVFRPPFRSISLFGTSGIIVGDMMGGLHVRTTENEEWVSSAPGEGNAIIKVEALSADHWVMITDTAIFTTFDGGATYTRFVPESFPGASGVASLDVTNDSLMHVTESTFGLWRSTDGGRTWIKLPAPENGFGIMQDVFFLSADTGFVASWYPWALYTTVDGGESWRSGPFEYPTAVAIAPNGMGVYTRPAILHVSNNHGMTWSDSLGLPTAYAREFPDNDISVELRVAGEGAIFLLLTDAETNRSIVTRIEMTSDVGQEHRETPPTLDLSSNDSTLQSLSHSILLSSI